MQESNLSAVAVKAHHKPEKPSPEFPLFPHDTGRWAKKIRGKLHYFGPWDDAEGALQRWLAVKDDLLAGRKPHVKTATKDEGKKHPKPRKDFPLFPHATGRWAKKVRGRFCYFGKLADDPKGEAALNHWLGQKDDLLAGRTPRANADGLTVRALVNTFLTSKRHRVDSGEIAPRTWADYHGTCERIVKAFGLTRLVSDLAPADFERYRANLAKVWGPVAIGNEVQRVRSLFRYGHEADLFDRPTRFGPSFKKPSRKVLRKARQKKGLRMFEATDIKALLNIAGVQMKAMILLGINCGFGNADVGMLPIKALDLKGGWVRYPRPKTGVERRCPLWPETVKTLRAAIAVRPEPKDEAHADLVFITKYGRSWHKDGVLLTGAGSKAIEGLDQPVSKETTKLLKSSGLHRPGLGFYALRHTFETIGGEARDQVAVDHIMGHARDDMASLYRERIGDDRLKAVTNHIRTWLFGAKGAGKPK